VALVALLLGCGGGSPAAGDGGTDAMPDAGPLSPASPPVLTPCPEGWTEAPSPSGVTTCEPWSGELADCGPGLAHFPGEAGCTPVGSPCPAGDWPADLPTDGALLHVQPGSVGGDGTPGRPFGTIAEAAAGAAPGTIIALSRGVFTGNVTIGAGVALWGACAAETTLRGVAATPSVAFRGVGAGVELRAVRIEGPGIGVHVPMGSELRMEGVEIEGTVGGGVLVEGGDLVAMGFSIRGVRAEADGTFGRGIMVQFGGTTRVTRGSFDSNLSAAVYAVGARSSVFVDRVAIRDTQPEMASGTGGFGMWLLTQATAEVHASVLEGNHDVAILLLGEGTHAEVHDSVLRRTNASRADGRFGHAVGVEHGSSADLRRTLLDENRDIALFVDDLGGSVHAEDLVVRDVRSEERSDQYGRGINVQRQATFEGARVWIERTRQLGLYFAGLGAAGTVTDLTVLDTEAQACAETTCADTPYGVGLGVYSGSELDLRRFAIRRSALCGVHVAEASTLSLHEGEVSEATIGACVQIDDYDISLLNDEVSYRDNGVNIEATSLPVPEIIGI